MTGGRADRDMFRGAMPSVGPAWAIMSRAAAAPYYPVSAVKRKWETVTSGEEMQRRCRPHPSARRRAAVSERGAGR